MTLFPTPVGMNRVTQKLKVLTGTIPHACGDEPDWPCWTMPLSAYSPRLWG